MTGTKGERQGRKEMIRGKGNRNISIIWREESYSMACVKWVCHEFIQIYDSQ
jgi:hypothetical protein